MNIVYRVDFQQYSPYRIGMKWVKPEMGMETPRLFYANELHFKIASTKILRHWKNLSLSYCKHTEIQAQFSIPAYSFRYLKT